MGTAVHNLEAASAELFQPFVYKSEYEKFLGSEVARKLPDPLEGELKTKRLTCLIFADSLYGVVGMSFIRNASVLWLVIDSFRDSFRRLSAVVVAAIADAEPVIHAVDGSVLLLISL